MRSNWNEATGAVETLMERYQREESAKQDGSGLVAVAWVPDDVIAKLRSGEPKIVLTGVPMLKYEGVNTSGIVVFSDAEAIIAAKDAYIERLRGCKFSDRNYSAIQSRLAEQAERIKELTMLIGEKQ